MTANQCAGHKHSPTLGSTVCGECGRFIPDTETSTAPDEPWTQHRIGAGGICTECGQRWPCDIAKAWRHGYSWAKVEHSLGELRKRLGAKST